jgi:membrane-associated phospholipid phosphatase
VVRNDVEVRLGQPQRPAARPLLPPQARPVAVTVVAVCVVVTAFLGVLVAHQSRPGWLDRGIDARLQSALHGHAAALDRVALPGSAGPVVAITAALIIGCLLARRWRGAIFVAIAVPAAEAITEYALKPLVGRTLNGYQAYPSGHTTGVFVLAAVFTVLLLNPPRPRLPVAARVLLVLAALLAACATALAMVGMGAHYFTDTVGGAAVAIAVALATALVLDRLGSPRQSAL